MKTAPGTSTLLNHGRDEGNSDPQSLGVSIRTLATVWRFQVLSLLFCFHYELTQ